MFRARIAASLLACAALLLFPVTTVQAAVEEKRVALVIGNSDYAHTAKLANPVRDARSISAALARLGFDVVEGYDLTQPEMRAKIREFTSRIEGADVTLFYYAGHGFQIEGKNHLAPVDARLSQESDVDFETVPLNLVLRQMERAQRTNLIFLDACRDNPLASKLARSMQGRSLGPERGLARVESSVGTLIGYATSPGMVAFDGEGEHSPYTSAMLKHIETPGLSINDMMIAVRQDVLAESKGRQIPWEHSSLTGQYYFKAPARTAALAGGDASQDSGSAAAVASAAKNQDAITAAYQATVAVGTCGAYRLFEDQHRSSFYGRLAEEYLRSNCDDRTRLIAVEPRPQRAEAPQTQEKQIASAVAGPPDLGTKTKEPEPEPEVDPAALTVSIQEALAKVGCNPGPADGDWGPRTRSALARFNAGAKAKLDTGEPSEATLAAIRKTSGTVCEPPPPATASKPRPERKERTVTTAPSRNYQKPPSRAAKEKEYWGGESTRFDCEVRGILTAQCFEKPPR